MIYDVVIIGAGAAGFGSALTLASANDKFDWAKNKKYLMLDNNKSDLNAGRYINVAGIEAINGVDLLNNLKTQLKIYPACELKDEKVLSIKRVGDIFSIICENSVYEAKTLILATGMHSFDIEFDEVEVKDNIFAPKPNKILLANENNKISNEVYVAGLASGVPSMFACASGDGTKVACDILKSWCGKVAIVHDVKA
ncbi:NAD(P)/FAD-dependent oxidoreductase [Aliarcobacter faecis]|uniref:FAD-dependent oxidoreductase n=1 Tax=Aliarcobacter faecis TaxID=1564138 RepID=UPI0004797E2E|nr:FAD-dependent oxidoreductase [Aliarcobacter faecis]QKF73568.1 NAD(P)/FAD-dependent oxidoreductase [Aliarcobacter faecis]